MPDLESQTSKLLLEGLYEPNTQDKGDTSKVIDFIKERGNYKKETVKLCDIFTNGAHSERQ